MPERILDRSSRSLDWPSAASIGAGIFFLVASLSGWGPWGALEDAAWRRLVRTQAGEVAPARALALEEDESESPTASGRARRLADDVDRLLFLEPALVVIEALPDEPSEASERDVLERLAAGLPSAKSGKKKRGKELDAVAKRLSAVAASLDADSRLARALTGNARILMAFSAMQREGEPIAPPACLDRSGFEVALKSSGKQDLSRQWEVARAPLAVFCAQGAVAALPLESAGDSSETGLVQVGERWYPALGLEAARRWFEVPAKGMRFHWVRGRLVALELKGVRYPLNAKGDFLLGDAPATVRVGLSLLRSGKLDKAIVSGRVVFLRPWPSRLAEAPAFDRQRRLFNALCARALRVDSAPGVRVGLWTLCGGLLILAIGLTPWWIGAPIAMAMFAGLWSGYSIYQEALARPMGVWLGAMLVGYGWALFRWHARRERARRWFLGSVAPTQEAAWRKRLPHPGQDTSLHGLYGSWQASEPEHESDLEAWAEEFGAFLDPARAGGFFLAMDLGQDPLDLVRALRALRGLDPKARLAVALGEVTFSAALRLGVARWSLVGKGLQLALSLLTLAQIGQLLLTEPDYFVLRDGIRVQLTGRSLADQRVPGDEAKVLNILAFNL